MKGLRTGWGHLALLALIAVLSIATAHADSWPLPTVKLYESADKRWRFEVTPRPIESQSAYFKNEIEREKTGAPPRDPSQRA